MCLGEILRLDTVSGSSGTARSGGRALAVSLVTLEEPVTAGDWVLVHSGFALQRLDPGQAADALSLRRAPSDPADPVHPADVVHPADPVHPAGPADPRPPAPQEET